MAVKQQCKLGINTKWCDISKLCYEDSEPATGAVL